MPMSQEEKDDLTAQLKASRKKQLNFGLCIASKAEDSALLIDRKKPPERLQKLAKGIAKSAKVACGLVESKGKLVMLTCNESPPSGAAKKLKVFLKAATGDALKVQLLDINGSVLEGDVDDEEAESADISASQSADTEAPANPLADKVDEALEKLRPRLAAALKQTPRAKDTLQKLIHTIKAAAQDNDAGSVKKRMGQLQEALTKLAEAAGSGDAVSQSKLSLVKLGKARIEWPDTRSNALGELERLKKKIEEDYADMPEASEQVSNAMKLLDKSFETFHDKLHDQLDAVLNAEEAARNQEVDAARKMIDLFSKHVEKDPIISALDGNDILPDISIAAPIRAKLAEISAALG